jgi:pimeloyl-ACP methyl ester carboxylesterase
MRLNRLETRPDGPETAPPLLIAHGLFGSARNWNGIAKRLAETGGRRVVAVDMRNHGDSPRAERQSYADMAGDLAEALADLGGEADLLGHSMGGKAAMTLALTRPGPLRRLVVADIAPVAYTHSHLPHIEAMRAVDLSGVRRRGDAERQLREAVPDRGVRAFLLQSLAVTPEGARWRLALDVLAEAMPGLVGWDETALPAEARWPGPALFLAGSESDYLTREHRPAIRARFPAARFAAIKGAGHWLHAERPEAFADTVAAFLDA